MMSNKTEKLLNYCVRIADEFQSRLSRIETFVKHNLSSGTANETILREFLSAHVAASFVVGQGFICDLFDSGEVSKQCDVLVYEQNHFPLIYSDGSIKIVLPRAARMVIEVKTRFTRKDVHSAVSNIESALKINRMIQGVIFAFSSPSLKSIRNSLELYPLQISPEHLPTVILLLDRDLIIHNWAWQRRKELEETKNPIYGSFSVREAKNKKMGLAISFLLLLLFQCTDSELYESDMINTLSEILEEYTVKRTEDIVIGSKVELNK